MTFSSGAELDQVRLRWLEGTVLTGLGRRKEALVELEAVRGKLIRDRISFDAALITLQIAGLQLEEGRIAEVKRLAGELVTIFQPRKCTEKPPRVCNFSGKPPKKERLPGSLYASFSLISIARATTLP